VLTVNFNLFKIRDGDRFLDVGCGDGRHSYEAYRLNNGSGMTCSMDLDDLCIRKTKYVLDHMDQQNGFSGNRNVLCGDALNLPFKDHSFNRIICAEVMEHVKDPDQGIEEMVRVLKPGGLLAVTVPTYVPEKGCWILDSDYYNHPGGHVRIFTARGLVRTLRRHNLGVYAIRYEHAFHSIYWILRCIFGLKNEESRIPAAYLRFLEMQITTKSRFVPRVERIFNFIFPKSIVIYTRRQNRGS
jgi:SAM-dependent methyltransferase